MAVSGVVVSITVLGNPVGATGEGSTGFGENLPGRKFHSSPWFSRSQIYKLELELPIIQRFTFSQVAS